MAKGMSKNFGKNGWALFLLILLGIVLGSFAGHLAKDVKFLSWLNYGIDFAIGDKKDNNIVSLDLAVIVIQFGLQIKITIGSIIGAVASVFIYKKI
ncbi:MAG TPA: DUF4321 domain-containing protein [Mobilitalea sp.]|nr:DUF4321 domain-containing protein [Mobilitalea sp.]